jgi:hypothetical protein
MGIRMGHYDHAYENMYEAQRARERAWRDREVPLVIEALQGAREKLRQYVNVIKHAKRIEAELEVAVDLLALQLVS